MNVASRSIFRDIISNRRITPWQVTQADFQISDAVSGVNMRLAAGGVRELHWHQASKWAVMTYGRCHVTVLDPQGRA